MPETRHHEPYNFPYPQLCSVRMVCIKVVPLERQWVTLHFTSDVQPQGRITRPRTPSSVNVYARHVAVQKQRHCPRVRGFTGTFSRSVLDTCKADLQQKQLWSNLNPFTPAAYVRHCPIQAGLRQIGQYPRHNDILYAEFTLKRISNSRYLSVHRPVALTVTAGVHKSFKTLQAASKL
jgi:hypothetical protein